MEISTSLKPGQFLWWVNEAGYSVQDVLEVRPKCLDVKRSARVGAQLFYEDVDREGFEYGTHFPSLSSDKNEEISPWIVANKFDAWSLGDYWEPNPEGIRLYEPLKVRALHRKFADLADDFSQIPTFADQFGFLGVDTWLLTLIDNQAAFGEPVWCWEEEAFKMRELILLWEDFKSGASDEELYEKVRYDAGMTFFREEYREQFPDRLDLALFEEFAYDYLPPELSSVSMIRRSCQTLITGFLNKGLNENVICEADLTPPPQIRATPHSLLGGIYLHFAQELLGKSDPLIRCQSCGKWFPSKHGSTKYCSDSCKMKAYRRRQKEATNG